MTDTPSETHEQSFDPNTFEGDSETLIGHEMELAYNEKLCEQTFMSEHEAFCVGLYLGERKVRSASEL